MGLVFYCLEADQLVYYTVDVKYDIEINNTEWHHNFCSWFALDNIDDLTLICLGAL